MSTRLELERELEEQTRLNGMSSEREARLLARVTQLEREKNKLAKRLEQAAEINAALIKKLEVGNNIGHYDEITDLWRENAELNRQIFSLAHSRVTAQNKMDEIWREMVRFKKDAERLDWMQQNRLDWPIGSMAETIREAIDAAMKEAQP